MSGKRRARPAPQYVSDNDLSSLNRGVTEHEQNSQSLPRGYPQIQEQYNDGESNTEPAFTTDQLPRLQSNTPGLEPAATVQPGHGGLGYQQASKRPNRCYTTDLTREFPPPISDLNLAPPPVILPAAFPNRNTPYEYFRSTLNVIPRTKVLLRKTNMPLALLLRPYTALQCADENVPRTADAVIARCGRCRGYINPYVKISSDGRRWRCNLCDVENDIPQQFFVDPQTNMPCLVYDRVELQEGLIEFIAPTEYLARPAMEVTYVFLIDVLSSAITCGLTSTVTRIVCDCLSLIPNYQGTSRVAFMGINSSVHFIKFSDADDDDCEMLVVSDLESPFLPVPHGVCVNLVQYRDTIERMLHRFASFFEDCGDHDLAFGAAARAAQAIISDTGGKIMAFMATIPNAGPGKLTVREDARVLGKPKEARALLLPATEYYKQFALECSATQVLFDMFLMGAGYHDVATLSDLARFTAGQTRYYPSWLSAHASDVAKLTHELRQYLALDIGLEGALKVRGLRGLQPLGFHGNFYNRSHDVCMLPVVPRDQSYVIEVAIEEPLKDPVVYFQAALLYTTSYGQRTVRVFNLAIPTLLLMAEVFASSDQLALVCCAAHLAITKVLASTLLDGRRFLCKFAADILKAYQQDNGGPGMLISLNLRMLALLMHSMSKKIAFRDDRVPSDHRCDSINSLRTLPIDRLVPYVYPTVYSLHDMSTECGQVIEGQLVMPEPINATQSSWDSYGLYMINGGHEIFLWVMPRAVEGLVKDVFGTNDLREVVRGKTELIVLTEAESGFNCRVRRIIDRARQGARHVGYENLYVVVGANEGEDEATEEFQLRRWALGCLVEDAMGGDCGYKEYLQVLKADESKP